MEFRDILNKYSCSSAELARRSGISTSTLSAFYQGTSKLSNMRLGTFLAMARALGVSLETLVDDIYEDDGCLGSDSEKMSLLIDFGRLNEKGRTTLLAVSRALAYDPSTNSDK